MNYQEQPGLLTRVLSTLGAQMDNAGTVDIVEFVEHPEYLNQQLYPRQKLLLKLYYRIELTAAELADARHLLSCTNKYARLFFPGIGAEEAYTLSDVEMRARFLRHHAYILNVIAGRRGSKSVLGAFTNAYGLYRLLRDPNPQRTWELIPGQEIGTANVAVDEDQALVLFNQLKAIIAESPWFQKAPPKALETSLIFTGRAIIARSLHSNSSSVRGKTLVDINLDEYAHMGRTGGKLSDKAMWAALEPSILTFHHEGRSSGHIVITTSPLNKAGKVWELFSLAEEGRTDTVIAVQLATWEMNPMVPRDHDVIVSAYHDDFEYAEMEYGAQWAEQVGYFMPDSAVEECGDPKLARTAHGVKGIRYTLHLDMSKKRDHTGLLICHYERATGSVIADVIEDIDPQDRAGRFVNAQGEIDQEAIYDYIVELHEVNGFNFNSITFDQFNSLWLIQRLRKRFPNPDRTVVEELTTTDKSNREMYGSLRSCITQGTFRYYRHPGLMMQLKNLSRTIKDSGAWKVEAPPGMLDDLADAAASAVWQCLQLALNIGSGLHVVERGELAPALPFLSPAELDAGLSHHRDCTVGYCVAACDTLKHRERLAFSPFAALRS